MKIKYTPALRAALLPAVGALALSFMTGCSSDKKAAHKTDAAAPLHVAGTVALIGQDVDFNPHSGDNECVGTGAFSDVMKGAQVRISDETGHTLAVTQLGMGIADTSTTDLASGSCDFTFGASLPSGKGSYTIQVTNHGNQTFTENQMAAPQLSLG